jgi:hypothetical protein
MFSSFSLCCAPCRVVSVTSLQRAVRVELNNLAILERYVLTNESFDRRGSLLGQYFCHWGSGMDDFQSGQQPLFRNDNNGKSQFPYLTNPLERSAASARFEQVEQRSEAHQCHNCRRAA